MKLNQLAKEMPPHSLYVLDVVAHRYGFPEDLLEPTWARLEKHYRGSLANPPKSYKGPRFYSPSPAGDFLFDQAKEHVGIDDVDNLLSEVPERELFSKVLFIEYLKYGQRPFCTHKELHDHGRVYAKAAELTSGTKRKNRSHSSPVPADAWFEVRCTDLFKNVLYETTTGDPLEVTALHDGSTFEDDWSGEASSLRELKNRFLLARASVLKLLFFPQKTILATKLMLEALACLKQGGITNEDIEVLIAHDSHLRDTQGPQEIERTGLALAPSYFADGLIGLLEMVGHVIKEIEIESLHAVCTATRQLDSSNEITSYMCLYDHAEKDAWDRIYEQSLFAFRQEVSFWRGYWFEVCDALKATFDLSVQLPHLASQPSAVDSVSKSARPQLASSYGIMFSNTNRKGRKITKLEYDAICAKRASYQLFIDAMKNARSKRSRSHVERRYGDQIIGGTLTRHNLQCLLPFIKSENPLNPRKARPKEDILSAYSARRNFERIGNEIDAKEVKESDRLIKVHSPGDDATIRFEFSPNMSYKFCIIVPLAFDAI